MMRRNWAWLIASLATLVAAAPAWAADYTVTKTSGLLESRPANATFLSNVRDYSATGSSMSQDLDLPFVFPYYGKLFDGVTVTSCGFIVPGTGRVIQVAENPIANIHGYDQSTRAFPYASGGDTDGVIAALWDSYFNVNDGPTATGGVYTWISGTAPTRHVVISWENAIIGYEDTTLTPATVQIHLYEGSGTIAFAYSTTGNYSKATSWVCGLDSFEETRYTIPLQNGDANSGKPANDLVFTPYSVTMTGTLQFDRIVSDASGIGNSVAQNEALGAVHVEMRYGSGFVAARAETAPDGSYSITGFGVPSTSTCDLYAMTSNAACVVATFGATVPREWKFASGVSLASGGDQGTASLSSSLDSSGSLRAAFHVASRVRHAELLVLAHTSKSIPVLQVTYDDTSSAPTNYQRSAPASGAPARLTVGGASAPNPDGWDAGIVTKAYGRHVLAAIAGSPTTAYDDRFDAATEPGNAFAEGFGAGLWAAVSGSSEMIDGTGASTAQVYDLESPQLTTRSDAVAGAVAGALYDLVDAANETTDAVDGTSSPARFIEVVANESSIPTIESFLARWIAQGHSGAELVRTLVGNGVLPDDASEPNDSAGEVFALGPVGLRRANLLLNITNEDWFSFELPAAADKVTVEVAWDRSSYPATVALDLLDGAGSTVATGAPSGATGPYRAVTGALAAGTYRIGVRHLSGQKVPSYAVQAFLDLGIAQKPFTDWTVGRAYSRSLGVTGGVPPVTVAPTGSALPPGISAGGTTGTGLGNPTQAGTFDVTLSVTDSAVPPHSLNRSQRIVIAPPIDVALPAYLGFPLGADVDADLPVTGGTAPRTYVVASGALPEGLSFDPGSFHVEGRADAPGFTDLQLDAADVAGSTDSAATRAVVCVEGAKRNVPLDLAAGDASCGFWVDGVVGSTLRISVKTARRAPKRALTVTVLAPDRSVVTTGRIKTRPGIATGSRIVCPASGRLYVIVSSESGEATQLLGGVTVAPPRRGRGSDAEFGPSEQLEVEVGALAGAKLVFKGSMPRRGQLTAKLVHLMDPDGYLVATDGAVRTVGKGFVLTIDLPTAGTWTVLVGAGPPGMDPAKLSYSFTLRQPRGAVYSAE